MKKVGKYARTMEKPEQKAVLRLFTRDHGFYTSKDLWGAYRGFRRRFVFTHMGCWCGLVGGITIGIEPDGHTHS